MKLFEKITNNSIYYSVIYSFVIITVSTIAGVIAMNTETTAGIDLRFIGPIAIFMMVLSVVFTLFPYTLLRAQAFKQLYKTGKGFSRAMPKAFLILEAMIAMFTLFAYMAAMGGSAGGGVGLILLTILNIIGLTVAGIAALVGFVLNRSSDEITKYRVDTIEGKAKVLTQSAKAHRFLNNL